jgi:hypothetical protein
MTRPDPHTVCDGCGRSFDRRLRSHVELGPIVHDDLWQRLANAGERLLCDECMYRRSSERLGRMPFATQGAIAKALHPDRKPSEAQRAEACRLFSAWKADKDMVVRCDARATRKP